MKTQILKVIFLIATFVVFADAQKIIFFMIQLVIVAVLEQYLQQYVQLELLKHW